MLPYLITISAYLIWGFIPIYWKLLNFVDPLELVMHRIFWTALLCLAIIPLRGKWAQFIASVKGERTGLWGLLAAVLLSINWFSFVWTVQAGRVGDSSLGYFLCPICSLFLGLILEKEKLRPVQWLGFILAGIAVAILFISEGRFPLVALTIAFSWAGYGYLKKKTALGPISSLGLETLLLAPLAALFIAWLAGNGTSAINGAGTKSWILILSTGAVTAAPLLLFADAAKRVSLSTLGIFQYIVPLTHFLLAYFVYQEPASEGRWIAFALVAVGCALYATEELSRARKRHQGREP